MPLLSTTQTSQIMWTELKNPLVDNDYSNRYNDPHSLPM
jgi:hypothetical protein